MNVIVLVIAAYLVGSIPFGVIVGKLRGFDPRAVGSGNIGMTNVVRAGGASAAAATFLGDMLKGLIPAGYARWAGYDPEVVAIVAFAAFVGAIASIFLRFRGGKGISAGLGIFLALAPQAVACALVVFSVAVAATRMVSVASLAAAFTLPIAVAAFHFPMPYLFAAIAISILAFARHRENIERILRGTESKFGRKKAAQPG